MSIEPRPARWPCNLWGQIIAQQNGYQSDAQNDDAHGADSDVNGSIHSLQSELMAACTRFEDNRNKGQQCKTDNPEDEEIARCLLRTTNQSLVRQYRTRNRQHMRNDHKGRIEKCGAKNQERPMWVRSKTHEQHKARGQLGCKDCRSEYRNNAGISGPGFPAKGMTASPKIVYVQMKAILIVKAE